MSKKNWHDSGCVREVFAISQGNYDVEPPVRTTCRKAVIRRTAGGEETRTDRFSTRPTRPMTREERERLGLR